LYDLRSLFMFRETLEALDPKGEPRAVILDAAPEPVNGPVGVLSGSFNPPTLAHMELARSAREVFRLERIYFAISRVTVDKETIEGLILEDRLLLLTQLTEAMRWASVALVNKGLYLEQAAAFRKLLGQQTKVHFVVGMDKVIQIFDPGYYKDREKALRDLFAESELYAAGRGVWGEEELNRLLDRAENRAYREKIHYLPFPEEMRDLSAGELRNRIMAGEPVKGQLPPTVEKFVAASGTFKAAYDTRSRLLDFLYHVREWAEKECDLKLLIRIAGEKSDRGKKLRETLSSDKLSPSEIQDSLLGVMRSDSRK